MAQHDPYAQYATSKAGADPYAQYAVEPSTEVHAAPPVVGAPGGKVPQIAAHPSSPPMQSSLLAPSTYEEAAKQMGKSLIQPFLHPLTAIETYPAFVRPTNDGPIQEIMRNPDKGAGVANALAQVGAGLLVGKALDTAIKSPSAVKRIVTGDVMVPRPGSTVSPAERYAAAKRLGVNLDAADATGSSLLGNVKKIGENSLAGGHLYDNLKAANTGALQGSTDEFLNGLYEGDRESGGRAIQDALRANHTKLRENAESGFERLTDATKGKPVTGAPAVGKSADTILDAIEPLAEKYPSMAPRQTLSVLRDLSQVGKTTTAPEVFSPFVDEAGRPIASATQPTPPLPDTWSDLQRLRSATHDLTTTSPDLVKSEAIAPLQRMTSSLDEAMTNAASGLTPEQLQMFRQANQDWKDMKATYDDPSSPFYHAVRTENPSTLFSKVGPLTPENAVNLRNRLTPIQGEMTGVGPNGPVLRVSPALGALRRGTIESALGTDNEGAPNFKTFGTKLNRIPADYRAELFSPEQNVTLRDINHTSNVLGKDFNPSGSGKLGQKVAEAAALVPTAGLPLVQYPLAKMMTNPSVVEWLMRTDAAAPSLTQKLLPIAAGGQTKHIAAKAR